MNNKLHVEKGRLNHLGVHRLSGGLSIVIDIRCERECGILIYADKASYIKPNSNETACQDVFTGKSAEHNHSGKKKEFRIPFRPEYRINGLYCVFIKDFPFIEFDYIFYADDKKIVDDYAGLLDSPAKFGDPAAKDKVAKARYYPDDYDWGEDTQPETPYHDSIIYKLHMRGFTKHVSSGVSKRGTFAGLMEKIPYLKELGITAVETMPIFEFQDVISNPAYVEMNENLLPYLSKSNEVWKTKTNYWGYTDGSYFAPKRAYASTDRPDIELKDLIRALHSAGIELIADFYFPPHIPESFILEVCRYWVRVYHMDGFKLMGCQLPVKLLTSDLYLKHTKLIFESVDGMQMLQKDDFKNVAVISQGFLYDARKYLKGDEDMLYAVTDHFRENPPNYAVINEITSYQGFTLADLVSYDRKHNELNGEDNRDGSDYNYSWNCGVEGKTRKKAVLSLRVQQCKNALFMLFTSQGTPVLLAGDEFYNSAGGNNNPYCQDNAVSWLNWKTNAYGEALLEFTRQLIAFRKAHPILHQEQALRQTDYRSLGFPDISYHCDKAWYAGFENYNRHIGIMYCGKYAKPDHNTEDKFIYAAYNMHWIDHHFALPKLPEGLEWQFCLSTCPSDTILLNITEPLRYGECAKLPPRSMAILIGEKSEMNKNESITTSEDNLLP